MAGTTGDVGKERWVDASYSGAWIYRIQRWIGGAGERVRDT